MNKKLFLANAFLVVSSAQAARANDSGAETTFIARMSAGNVATYHYAEAFQTRGRLIFPDVGYIDFGKNGYREVFAGAGAVLVDSPRLLVIQEGYFAQALGPDGDGAAYIQPWTFVLFRPHPRIAVQANYFAYLPVNNAATFQHVLEHAKVEYDWGRARAGLGLAAYKFGEDPTQWKPYFTLTLPTRAGEFEFWLQQLPRGKLQGVLRWTLSVKR